MTPTPGDQPRQKHLIRETIVSIIIAFAMAFLFRGFVVEAFLIPTGSMAPTLLGQHMRFRSRLTGYSWPVDTRDKNPNTNEPLPIQGTPRDRITVHDPMSAAEITETNVPVRWGDRIFVMKYLYSVYDPQRFDVVVFKNPTDPTINFIKRLIGLPGEQVAFVDGDVFVRTPRDTDVGNPWTLPGWRIARKPDRAQRAMWQPIFSSEYTPRKLAAFRHPWKPTTDASRWRIADNPAYEYSGAGPSGLAWDYAARPIDDSYAYNEVTPHAANLRYPVSDVRIGFGVRPGTDSLSLASVLLTRRHEFRAEIENAAARLRMRRTPDGAWTTLAETTLPAPLPRDKVTNIEVWHVDQSLTLYINDAPLLHAEYNWGPDERLRHTLGISAEDAARSETSLVLAEYPRPGVRLEFSAGPLTLYRVALARDIHYRPDVYGSATRSHSQQGKAARATHPNSTHALKPWQYFLCGDNSPASLDGRLWDSPSPYVEPLDPDLGVVHRDLLIGKAFWVYFPAPERRAGLPIPDFGRMRFIW